MLYKRLDRLAERTMWAFRYTWNMSVSIDLSEVYLENYSPVR